MKTNNLKNQKSIVENSSKNEKPENKGLTYSVYNKNNFKKFCELNEDKTAKVILQNDLPSKFDVELCEFLNLFRRKTIHEKSEWEFYIDYENIKLPRLVEAVDFLELFWKSTILIDKGLL